MKTYLTITLLLCSILYLSTLTSCLKHCDCERISLSGQVTNIAGDPVNDALVQINDNSLKTDQEGNFQIKVCTGPQSFLVSVNKFGFGLYSRRFESAFDDLKIRLTQGTVVEIDPTVENVIEDTNATNNVAQSALMELDTTLLFNVVPRVYDHNGKLIDLGYPDEVKGIFDYVRTPRTSRRGMSMRLRANSLRSRSGNPPAAGQQLQVAVSTVDFFNPDGMPGDFTVRFTGDPRRFDIDTTRTGKGKEKIVDGESRSMKTDNPKDSVEGEQQKMSDSDNEEDELREQLAFMESFGAATIDITDGEEMYQLVEGMTATVTIPVYSIRQEKNEFIPPVIPLLHYNETDGVWEVTGQGVLNEAGDAYIAEVSHFSVVNFDMVKTGDSKCFKIRQMLVNGTNDNTISGGGSGALPTYRAHLLVPQTGTSTFSERRRTIDESTGCVSVEGTALHGVSRLDDTVPYIVAVFSEDAGGTSVGDTLSIAIIDSDPFNSIPAETAVADLGNCGSASGCDISTCESTNDAINMSAFSGSVCNTCWQSDCPVIPFDNSGAEQIEIVGVPTATSGQIRVKWVYDGPTTINGIRVTVMDATNTTEIAELTPLTGGTPPSCLDNCFDVQCTGGSYDYTGSPGATVSFRLQLFTDANCGGLPEEQVFADNPVTIL